MLGTLFVSLPGFQRQGENRLQNRLRAVAG